MINNLNQSIDINNYLAEIIKELIEIPDEKKIAHTFIKRLQELTQARNIFIHRAEKDEIVLLGYNCRASIDKTEVHLNHTLDIIQNYLSQKDGVGYVVTIDHSGNILSKSAKSLVFLSNIPLNFGGKLLHICCSEGNEPLKKENEKLAVLEAYCWTCGTALENSLLQTARDNQQKKLLYGKEKMDLIIEFVNQNYQNEISKNNIASRFNLHPDYLSRQFKKFTGKTVTDYINNLRIVEATGRIRNSTEKIIEIAMSVGFNSLRTFNRDFRDITGVSPRDFRRQIIRG
jgi:AraC-like DNA-binding protein